jgi:hypothetical protein
MSWDPNVYWLLYQERRSELERAAEIERLLAAGRPNRPGRTDRWLTALGGFLIEVGLRLRTYALDNQSIETAP